MHALEWLAEQKIADAVAAGAFDDLPGSGRPLDLDDDRLVPEDLRMVFRILRNAGLAPPEVEARKEFAGLRALAAGAAEDTVRRRAFARLALIEAQLGAQAERSGRRGSYFNRVIERFER